MGSFELARYFLNSRNKIFLLVKTPSCEIPNWTNGASCSFVNGQLTCQCPCLFSGPKCQICKSNFLLLFFLFESFQI